MTQPRGFGSAQHQWAPPNGQWGPPTQQFGPQQEVPPHWFQPSPTMPLGSNVGGDPQPPKQKKWPWIAAGVVGTLIVGSIAGCLQDKSDPAAQPPASTASAATHGSAPKAKGSQSTAVPQTGDRSSTVPTATSWTMPSLRGSNLQDAQDAIQRLTDDAIFFTSSHDVSGASRMQILDRDWRVCSQNIPSGTRINAQSQIDFGVVKLSESCP